MLCLSAGTLAATLAASQFTLAWTHSIERIRWEEDWRVESAALVVVEARIRGSGAGMEIPEGAVLKNGVWHYRPALPPQGNSAIAELRLAELRLTHSPHAAGYELCIDGDCRPLADRLPGIDNHATVVLAPCPG